MALPTYVAEGSIAAGVAAITPGLPAGIATDDILLLWLETQGDQAISIANENGGTWTLIGNPNVGGSAGTRLTAFWSRYNGTQGDPTTSDSGNHNFGYIEAYRGCVASGTPYEGLVTGTETTADTSLEVTGSTTTGADRLVIVAASRENDDFNDHYSAWANVDLANIVERSDRGSQQGNGGGLATMTGEKASAGTYTTTTATVANSVLDAFMTFALIPAAGGTTYFGASTLALTLTIVTAAFKTTFGMAALALTFGIATVGRVTAFGSSTFALTFGSTTNGTRTTFGASATPFTFGATTTGTVTAFGAASLPLTFNITTRSGASSYFGSSSLGLTLGVTTEGRRGIGGASSLALTFGSTTAGERTARGTVSLALTLGIVTSGIRSTFGAASLPLVLTITTAAAEPPEALLYPEAAPGRLVTQPTFGVLDTYPTSGVLDRPDAVTLER